MLSLRSFDIRPFAVGGCTPSEPADSPSLEPRRPRDASSSVAASSLLCLFLEFRSFDSLLPAPVSPLFLRSSTDPRRPTLSLSVPSFSLSSNVVWSGSLLPVEALDEDMPTIELFPLRLVVNVAESPRSGDAPNLASASIITASADVLDL
jgi:hypothetical protein